MGLFKNGWENWINGWINSNEQTKEWFNSGIKSNMDNNLQNWKNGWVESFKLSGDWLIDVLIISAIIGVIFNMAGSSKWGNKLILGSILIGLLMKVIF